MNKNELIASIAGEVREMGHMGRREQVLYRGAVSGDGIALVP